MIETWYVMEDGSCAHPRDVAPDANGVLRHKDGRAVEYKPHGPRTRGVDPDQERTKPPPKPQSATRDMKPEEPKRPYRTRESKAE